MAVAGAVSSYSVFFETTNVRPLEAVKPPRVGPASSVPRSTNFGRERR
jgi:hypothetical protein